MSLWIGLQVSPIEEAIEACNINSGVFSGSSEFAHVCTVFSPKPPLHLLFAITCEVAICLCWELTGFDVCAFKTARYYGFPVLVTVWMFTDCLCTIWTACML